MLSNTQNSNNKILITVVITCLVVFAVIFGLSAGCVLPNWFGLCKKPSTSSYKINIDTFKKVNSCDVANGDCTCNPGYYVHETIQSTGGDTVTITVPIVASPTPPVQNGTVLTANVTLLIKPSYQWQISIDNIDWEDINGATGVEYKIQTSQLRQYIRVKVTINSVEYSVEYYSKPVITNENIKQLVMQYIEGYKTNDQKQSVGGDPECQMFKRMGRLPPPHCSQSFGNPECQMYKRMRRQPPPFLNCNDPVDISDAEKQAVRDNVRRLYGEIGTWNVSTVSNMNNLFNDMQNFNEDISNWNTSNVTNMLVMFRNVVDFNQDLSKWDVSNVTNMRNMFNNATNFNNGDTPGESNKPLTWDVSKVTNMGEMFYMAKSFNQDISNWDTSKVTNMRNMFYAAWKFNQDLCAWKPRVGNVTDRLRIFEYANMEPPNYQKNNFAANKNPFTC